MVCSHPIALLTRILTVLPILLPAIVHGMRPHLSPLCPERLVGSLGTNPCSVRLDVQSLNSYQLSVFCVPPAPFRIPSVSALYCYRLLWFPRPLTENSDQPLSTVSSPLLDLRDLLARTGEDHPRPGPSTTG